MLLLLRFQYYASIQFQIYHFTCEDNTLLKKISKLSKEMMRDCKQLMNTEIERNQNGLHLNHFPCDYCKYPLP